MSYFVVTAGSIHEAYETFAQASASAAHHVDARVISDEWVALGSTKHNLDHAYRTLDDLADVLEPYDVERRRTALDEVRQLVDSAWARLGLAAA
jgi:hypothetical protein